jgi:hypothetical protein
MAFEAISKYSRSEERINTAHSSASEAVEGMGRIGECVGIPDDSTVCLYAVVW